MYDGIDSLAAGIHNQFPNAAMVAGYIDGAFAWTSAQFGLWPASTVKVKIAVFASTNAGDVIDCETGDATPAQAAAWVNMRIAAGYYRPTIYCNLSTVPAVRTATGSLILGQDYDIWVADYDGSTASVYAGTAAKQYLNTASYDKSIVYDDAWPHRTAPSLPSDWYYWPVRNLSVVNVGPSSVKLTWDSPNGPDGAAAVGQYQVTIRKNGQDLASYPRTSPKTAVTETYQYGSLPSNTALVAFVRAMEADGSHAGIWSTVNFTTT
jgi:hypothetical protein